MVKHNYVMKWVSPDLEKWVCSHCGRQYIEPDLLDIEDCHIIYDNILNCTEHIIVHQVNYQGVMGAGLALQIKNRFPIVFEKYQNVCSTLSWEQAQEAGAVDFVLYDSVDDANFYVANMFGQRYYGKYQLSPDYTAMKTGFKTIYRFAKREGLMVAIPYGIGCGLGKGNWTYVLGMIEDIFTNEIEYNIYRL